MNCLNMASKVMSGRLSKQIKALSNNDLNNSIPFQHGSFADQTQLAKSGIKDCAKV